MIALLRYSVATMLHAQRYLAPVLLFLGLVAMFSTNDSGPLAPVYSSCGAAMLLCATWFTIALINGEDPTHRAITIVAVGRSSKVLLGSVLVAVLSCAVLSFAGLLLPLLFGTHPLGANDLLIGIEAQFIGTSVGIAIGLLCSRLVLRRQGYALILALALVLVLVFVPGMPPVNVMLDLLGSQVAAEDLVLPMGGLLGIALLMLTASAGVTQFAATRRE